MNNWINIKDKVPKYTNDYLTVCEVSTPCLGNYKEVRIYRYETWHDKWIIPETINEIIYITHWAELPQLPKERDNE